MKVLEIASSPAYVAHPGQPLAAAAREMQAHDIGALVVVEPQPAKQRPLGILTDRDVVCGQILQRKDMHCLMVGEVMTPNPVSVRSDAEHTEVVETLRAHAVRRAPVVDASGELVGIITLDDLLPLVAQELSDLAGIARAQLAGIPVGQRTSD